MIVSGISGVSGIGGGFHIATPPPQPLSPLTHTPPRADGSSASTHVFHSADACRQQLAKESKSSAHPPSPCILRRSDRTRHPHLGSLIFANRRTLVSRGQLLTLSNHCEGNCLYEQCFSFKQYPSTVLARVQIEPIRFAVDAYPRTILLVGAREQRRGPFGTGVIESIYPPADSRIPCSNEPRTRRQLRNIQVQWETGALSNQEVHIWIWQ